MASYRPVYTDSTGQSSQTDQVIFYDPNYRDLPYGRLTERIWTFPDDLDERVFFDFLRNLSMAQLTHAIKALEERLDQISPIERPEQYAIIENRRRMAVSLKRNLESGEFVPKRRKTGAGVPKSVIMKGKRIYINMR